MTGQELYERLYDAYVNGTVGTPTIGWAQVGTREQAEWDQIARQAGASAASNQATRA